MASLTQLSFNRLLDRINFGGGGLFGGSTVSSTAKKEYIKAVVDDAFDRYGEAREYLNLEEWDEIIARLKNNKKDILSDKDIQKLDTSIRKQLKS